MKRFRNILVPLHFTRSDRAVVKMVSQLVSWSAPATVTFCHDSPRGEVPESLRRSHPWLLGLGGEQARERLREDVLGSGLFPDPSILRFEAEEANPVTRPLERLLEGSFDLLVTGGDRPDIAVRLARKAPCPVCVVPAESPGSIRRTAVGVDFSQYSRHACEIGRALAEAAGGDPPVLLHICQLYDNVRLGPLSREEFVAANERHARLRIEEFCLGFDVAQDPDAARIHHHESVAYGILEIAAKLDIDCLVVGSRGRDAPSPLLLGSVAEELLTRARIPVLAVKAKGTGDEFLRSLLGMPN